jgi:predicted nucleic-acid-binding protein
MSAPNGSLDANVLLRLTLKDLPEHFERAKRLVSAPGARFAMADTAAVEYVFALERHYGLSRGQIAQMVRGVIALPVIECRADLLEAAVGTYAAHPALSFEDCCLAESARLAGAVPLWTFDKKLARQSDAARAVP